MADAFAAAAEQWPRNGVPANVPAWLVSVGRFKALDRARRRARFDAIAEELVHQEAFVEAPEPRVVRDDELRLMVLCCHPCLSADARVALTLREVGGLTTEEIARAFLTTAPTIAQRIVRAKAKLREHGAIADALSDTDLTARLETVSQALYLIFNEGYAATRSPHFIRADLCEEAIRIGRHLVELTEDLEALGLLALMLLHHSRRAARTNAAGELVLLADQDRTLWDRRLIEDAEELLRRAALSQRIGPYGLQATIAATHAQAHSLADTDWRKIVALYDLLLRLTPTPVVSLNRAVALGMRDGPRAGLEAVQAAMHSGALSAYPLAYAARAEFERQLDHREASAASYRAALALTVNPAEQRLLQRRLDELSIERTPNGQPTE